VLVLSPRPAEVVADVRVELPRPRRAEDIDGAAFSRTAALIRAHLAGDEPTVPTEAGSEAWFDPLGEGA
jgi:hypothetical protein